MSEGPRSVSFRVDAGGRLVAPPGDAARIGLTPGSSLAIETGEPLWVARRPVEALAKVYVEATNRCNLSCATCMRNVWEVPSGFMPAGVFDALLAGLAGFPSRPSLFLGGLGEPLGHPDVLTMIEKARGAGHSVELITNGILLGDEVRRALVSLGVERLWVSIDGATRDAYRDVRLGDALPAVVENLRAFRALRDAAGPRAPRLGVVFVAMRRNVAQLPAVVALGRELGMDRLLVTNVVAYTEALRDEVLYDEALAPGDGDSPERPAILLPRMEPSGPVRRALAETIAQSPVDVRPRQSASRGRNFCPFVEAGTTAVRWDGGVGPCLPLLHDHVSHLGSRRRRSCEHLVGNVRDRSLREIWEAPAYLELRRRLRAFDFSPCASCNTCNLAGDNLQDCTGSSHPTCGGCLWAQGLVQCP